MKKAVLISIQPKWCELIASGKKIVEVRKTKPKLETPFKCYIYETKESKRRFSDHRFNSAINGISHHTEMGKVIGEFVCDEVTEIKSDAVYSRVFGGFDVRFNFDKYAACLTEEQIIDYLGEGKGFAWHISDLVLYDKPKELREFERACPDNVRSCAMCRHSDYSGMKCVPIAKAPQSWCYVEERSE